MQKIILVLTSTSGEITQQSILKPEGRPVQLKVAPGTKLDVRVEGQLEGVAAQRSANVSKRPLDVKQVGKNLVIEDGDEKLVEVTDFYDTPQAVLGSVDWAYAAPVDQVDSASPEAKALASEVVSDFNAPAALGLAAAGVLAAASFAGGGQAASAPAGNIVNGTFVAGPAVMGNNLVVKLYKTDGTALLVDGKQAQGSVDANGKFSINIGSHTGGIVVQLVGKGGGADYRDEASGLDVDLTTDLVAVGVVGAAATTLNINPLTTMAAKMAGVTSSNGTLHSAYNADVAALANTVIAKAFGLSGDVTKLDSTPVITTEGKANAAASDLGKVLAALSGVDAQKGGMSATIDSFVDSGGALVTSSLKNDLIQGAAAVDAAIKAANDGKGVGLVSKILSMFADTANTAGYSINDIATDNIIDATESAAFADGTSTITFKVPSTVTTESAATDLEIWLLGADRKGAGTITVKDGVATYTFGAGDAAAIQALTDGPKIVQIKVASTAAADPGKVLAERMVMLDKSDDAPTSINLVNQVNGIDENTPITDGKKVADIVVIDIDGGAVPALNSFVVSNASNFEVKQSPTTHKFELWLKSGVALNHEDPSLTNHALTTTVTLGGTAAKTYTLAIADVNEAPIAEGTIADQIAVKGQNAWRLDLSTYFADVDADDAFTYTLTSGTLPNGLTLINGIISGTPTANATQALFTVTATDKAGLTATQSFKLAVVPPPEVQSFTVVNAVGSNNLGKSGDKVTFEITLSEEITFTSTFSATFSVGGVTVNATGTAPSDASGTNKLSFTATLPDTVNGTFTLTSLTGGGTIQGKLSHQSLTPYTGSLSYAGYTVDNTAPTITSASFSVAENATAFTGSGALQADETVTWSLGTGHESALFDLTNGVLSLKAAKNYEADVTSTHSYSVDVIATDTAGNQTSKTVTVNLTDVNEAPTRNGTISAQHAVSGQAYSFDTHSYFADVDAGTNGILYYAISGAHADFYIDATTGVIRGTHTGALAAQSVTVTATDRGGRSVTQTFDMDVVVVPPPEVQSFTVVDAVGATNHGKSGDTVTFEITLSEEITFTSTFSATFSVGGVTVTATGTATSNTAGTNKLSFTATLPDTVNGTFTLTSLTGGGTIQGKLSHQSLASYTGSLSYADYTVDNNAPTITSASITGVDSTGASKTDALVAGDKVRVTLNASEAVTVTGTPEYTLDVGGVTKKAVYVSGTGTNSLVFEYVVAAGDTDSTGGITAGQAALTLRSGSAIKDLAGNVAATAVPAIEVGSNGVAVDAVIAATPGTPVVQSVDVQGIGADGVTKNQTLVTGDKIQFTLNVSESVTVTGSPKYTIDVGGVSKQATYLSGSGSNKLVFEYVIANGDTDTSGGITTGTSALVLAAGDKIQGAISSVTLTGLSNTALNTRYTLVHDTSGLSFGKGYNPSGGASVLDTSKSVFSATVNDETWYLWARQDSGYHLSRLDDTSEWYWEGASADFATDPSGFESFNKSTVDAAHVLLGEGTTNELFASFAAADRPTLREAVPQIFAGNNAIAIDSTAPTITSASFSVAENATAFTGSGALQADETVTWSLGAGHDSALFDLTNGVLSLKAAKNYEADVTSTHSYSVDVIATDAAGNQTSKTVTVNLTDVNDAPTANGTISAQHAVSGQAYSFDTHSYFADVDAGTNGTLRYAISGAHADFSIDATTGVISGTHTGALAAQQVTVTATDGGGLSVSQTFNMDVVTAPALSTQLSSSVTNLDVRSNIVFTVGEHVTAVAGKKITLTDLQQQKDGYAGDIEVHSQTIDVTDTNQVEIRNNSDGTCTIIVNPKFDLDLSSHYSLSVDTGAFLGETSGQNSQAFTTFEFQTVTPGLISQDTDSWSGINAEQAQQMSDQGALQSSLKWLSLDPSDDGTWGGVGDPSTKTIATLDAGTENFAFVLKDYDTTPSGTPFTLPDTYLRFNNFGADDLIYIDVQALITNGEAATGHDLAAFRAELEAGFFTAGNGTAETPFTVQPGGLRGEGACLEVVVDASITLPSTSVSPNLAAINANHWSHTGVAIIG